MNKIFDRKLYEENNGKGIKTAQDFLGQFDFETIDEREAYCDRDFIVKKGSFIYKVEAEKSNNWTTEGSVPGHWSSITVPYRKRHSGADYFILCNKNLTTVAICKMADVKTSPVSEKFIYMTGMKEAFFYVPLDKFDYYIYRAGIWMLEKEGPSIL